jgi:hypothetical protein
MGQTTTIRVSDDTKRMLEAIREQINGTKKPHDEIVHEALDIYAVLKRAGFKRDDSK